MIRTLSPAIAIVATTVSSMVASVAAPVADLAAGPPPEQLTSGPIADAIDVVEAIGDGREFLTTYVAPDGRVVRHDQGGDTVSEGQGYAMLISAAIGDEETFRRVWSWTDRELRRSDGLFAWQWSDGAVVDDEAAADADLFIAGALSLAGHRFEDPALTSAADRISTAVLELETIESDGRRVLAAGPWAIERRVLNPSYAVFPLMSRLWWDGQWAWAGVASGTRRALDELTRNAPHLPPDWASLTIGADGQAWPQPSGRPPRYGWDAVRVPVQLAADCNELGQRVAARMWPFFLSQGVTVAAVYSLDGTVLDRSPHPAAMVGAAGAASAAGADESVAVLLDRAAMYDADQPTYYGAAWLALGRLWLTTSLLGGCADR